MCWNVENAGTNTDRQAANGMNIVETAALTIWRFGCKIFFLNKKNSGRGLEKQKNLSEKFEKFEGNFP